MTDTDFVATIQQFVEDGLAQLNGEERAWAARHIVEPRPIEVSFPGDQAETIETVWLVTDFVDGDLQDYRIIYDPALIVFGLIRPDSRGRPVLIGLYGDFAETVRGL